MNKIPIFKPAHIESLARLLGDCGTGTDISRFLERNNLEDNSGESTKWRRLESIFTESQKKHNCSNQILAFIKSFIEPARFIDKKEEFEGHRQKLNKILILAGLEYKKNGQFQKCEQAQTLDEVEKRVQTIRSKFKGRNIHPEVLKYCRAELMQDNLFHAVFEATKGLAERIRQKSEVEKDGSALVDHVFSTHKPVLAFNSLQTETEKSEQKGFSSLLKGCFSAIRNPIAHEPKIYLWKSEDDIVDCFSLISFLHRKLNNCVITKHK